MQHVITVEGRSLLRTYLAGATKDAAVYEMSDEQAQRISSRSNERKDTKNS